MLIGIDWGGTKIEGVALTEDGKELTRRREPTPRHDYNGCIQLIAGLVQKIVLRCGIGTPVRSEIGPYPSGNLTCESTHRPNQFLVAAMLR